MITKTEYKTEFTNIEVMGAEALFNRALNEDMGTDEEEEQLNEELFVTGGTLNSTSSANGHPLEIDGYKFSHCVMLPNHLLRAICYDEDENQIVYDVTYNQGFYKLDN